MSTLSNHIRRTKPSKEARTQLVASAQHLNKRELERKLGKPEMTAVYLKPDLIKKLEELKIVFGMTSLERILNQLADQALARARVKEKKRLEKLEREKVSSRRADPGRSQTETEAQFTPPPEQQRARQLTPPAEQPTLTATSNPTAPATDSVTAPATVTGTAIRSRYVPKPMRVHLIRRDRARCAYVDPLTKRQCSETRHLEFDHVQPFARGGQTTDENLRVLCANHNRFRAPRMGFSSYRR
jgi:hypothetical protein